MEDFFKSASLLFALLNPFLMSIYLLDLIRDLDAKIFFRVLARGALISGLTFTAFAWGGEAIFSGLLGVSFAAFQIFGGVIFVVIGLRFVFHGAEALRTLRGTPQQVAGSIAMPFMIGPGTVSASVVIGGQNPPLEAAGAIALTMVLTVTTVCALKWLHDWVQTRNERLIERYVDVVGRLSALLIGTIALEMILQGLGSWIEGLG